MTVFLETNHGQVICSLQQTVRTSHVSSRGHFVPRSVGFSHTPLPIRPTTFCRRFPAVLPQFYGFVCSVVPSSYPRHHFATLVKVFRSTTQPHLPERSLAGGRRATGQFHPCCHLQINVQRRLPVSLLRLLFCRHSPCTCVSAKGRMGGAANEALPKLFTTIFPSNGQVYTPRSSLSVHGPAGVGPPTSSSGGMKIK